MLRLKLLNLLIKLLNLILFYYLNGSLFKMMKSGKAKNVPVKRYKSLEGEPSLSKIVNS